MSEVDPCEHLRELLAIAKPYWRVEHISKPAPIMSGMLRACDICGGPVPKDGKVREVTAFSATEPGREGTEVYLGMRWVHPDPEVCETHRFGLDLQHAVR